MSAALPAASNSATPAARDPAQLRPLRALLPFVAPYRAQVLLALLFLALAAGATLALPYAVRLLVDGGLSVEAGDTAARLAAVRQKFLLLFGVAVALGAFTSARFFMVTWLGERVTTDLRRAVYAHVLTQSPQFFETLKTGEVLSRLTTDTTVIQTAIGSSVSMGLRNLVLVSGGMVMLVLTSPRLMITVIGIIALVVAPAVLIGRRVRKLSRASQDRIADTSGIAGEILNAIPIVQSFTQERSETERYHHINEQAFSTSIRRTAMRSGLTAFVIIGVFGSLLWGLYGGVQAVYAGRISAGRGRQRGGAGGGLGRPAARLGCHRAADGAAGEPLTDQRAGRTAGTARKCRRCRCAIRRGAIRLSVAADVARARRLRPHDR
jgi:ATP-binding cassette, subfamily B, bacterial